MRFPLTFQINNRNTLNTVIFSLSPSYIKIEINLFKRAIILNILDKRQLEKQRESITIHSRVHIKLHCGCAHTNCNRMHGMGPHTKQKKPTFYT